MSRRRDRHPLRPSANQFELSLGVVTGTRQRPGLDMGKAQIQSLLFELGEFFWRDVASRPARAG